MNLLIFLAIVVILTVIPVMIAAKMLKANRSSFWICLLAVIASVASDHLSSMFIANDGIAYLVALAITALCFSAILGASFIQSLVIALVSIGIQFVIALLLAVMGLQLMEGL